MIRPADKGSGIVVVDKNEYISELLTEMDRSDIYERTEQKQIEDSYKEIKKLVDKMHKEGVITKEMKQYLMPKYATAGKLKGNPKIHKKDIPYRTIVSGINTPTERIAELVEHELNQYVESSPSYIQDTNDFINKLADFNDRIPKDSISFCFDVCKLYPSVPRKEGLAACKEALETRSTKLIDTENAMKLIEVVLDNKIFEFGDNYFIQRKGVAISSKLGKKTLHVPTCENGMRNF